MDVRDVGLNGGYLSRWDYTNKKLIHLKSNTAAAFQEASGDLSAITFTLLVESR
jgi:hypothetical protein